MKPSEILLEVLNLYTDDSGWRPVLEKPFGIGEYIYASDGHSCIRIRKEGYEIPTEQVEGKVPQADIHFNDSDYEGHITIGSDDLLAHDGDFQLLGLDVQGYLLDRLKLTIRLLGLDGFVVCRKNTMLMFDGGCIEVVLCGYLGDKNFPELQFTKRDVSFGYDFTNSESVIQELQEKRAKAAEREAARPKIWAFTITRYASMYVEAATVEEAEKIAKKNMEDIDEFDFDDVDIDSYDAHPYEPEKYMNVIYTADGTKSYDEYDEEDEDDE